MVTSSTSKFPIPKSWDEFEDICADLLEHTWNDPYLKRHGRAGQKQQGVDICGLSARLNPKGASNAYSGAQCKNVSVLKIKDIEAEVDKAKLFKPQLQEFVVMTTVPRDVSLEEAVRTHTWPFRVEVMFWEEICRRLARYPSLVQAHFPQLKTGHALTSMVSQVLNTKPADFQYDDSAGTYTSKLDNRLVLRCDRTSANQGTFNEPWVQQFPDKVAYRQLVYIEFAGNRVETLYCALVDGGRAIVPFPRSASDLVIDEWKYKIGEVVNHPLSGGIDDALRTADIQVAE